MFIFAAETLQSKSTNSFHTQNRERIRAHSSMVCTTRTTLQVPKCRGSTVVRGAQMAGTLNTVLPAERCRLVPRSTAAHPRFLRPCGCLGAGRGQRGKDGSC